jgi:hypothetical protein
VRPAVLVCLLAALAGTACEHRPRVTATKQTLVVLPTAWRRPSINVADDGKHVTYSVREGNGWAVVTPKGRGPTYDDVGGPLFAAKSDRVFYWGRHDAGDRRRYDVVADGVVVPTPLVAMRAVATGAGGARWATRGLVDPAETPGADPASPMAVMVDGREAGRWASVTAPVFSPDAKHVAWAARSAAGETTIVVDGAVVRTLAPSTLAEDGPKFEELASVRYLSDGRLIAFVPDGDGWVVMRDDETLARYGQIAMPGRIIILGTPATTAALVANTLTTAANAPVALWWERMAGQAEHWRVVRDGQPVDGMVCDRYWDTQLPITTDDGSHVAYVCPTPVEPDAPLGRRWVLLDGRRFGPYIENWSLGISPDGTQVAYGGADTLPIRGWRIYVNGTPRTWQEPLVWRPRFSSDGAHLLWSGAPERGRGRLFVDRHTVTRFDDVVYGPELPDAHSAEWVIRRGRKLSRITVKY